MKGDHEKLSISLMITLLFGEPADHCPLDHCGQQVSIHIVPSGPPSPKKIPPWPSDLCKGCVRVRVCDRALIEKLSSQCQGFDRAIITQANTPVGSNIVYAAENKKTLKVTPGIFSTFIKLPRSFFCGPPAVTQTENNSEPVDMTGCCMAANTALSWIVGRLFVWCKTDKQVREAATPSAWAVSAKSNACFCLMDVVTMLQGSKGSSTSSPCPHYHCASEHVCVCPCKEQNNEDREKPRYCAAGQAGDVFSCVISPEACHSPVATPLPAPSPRVKPSSQWGEGSKHIAG
ncbi:Alpha-28-sialyltransferase 8F [Dissostichus eleginoides]|uniref:Alpha-28-sialyltransferase 8F n=1 Tax=Dissostichus eleginoides TaxID=100907 RepID=A0AAD9ETD4_DISEL|nr:Alpha-28-sialyltransferase 8F [Dissostichus eleginoides]